MLRSAPAPAPRSSSLSMTLRRKGLLAAAAATAVTALSLAPAVMAQASTKPIPNQNGEGMDTHLFRPAVDSKGLISVNGSDVLGAWDFSFGLMLDWGHVLMRTNPDAGVRAEELITDSLQGTLGANLGLFNWASIGISAPLTLVTGVAAEDIGRTGDTYNTTGIDYQTFAGIAFHAKLRLTRVDDGVGFALLAQGGVPFGNAPRNFANDPGFWYWPQIIIENRFFRSRKLSLAFNAGYRGHTSGDQTEFGKATLTGLPQLEEGGFQNGNLITGSLGVGWRVLEQLDLVLETYMSYLPTGKDDTTGQNQFKQVFSQEYLGGIKVFVERNSYLTVGAGWNAYSRGFEAANFRGVLGFVYEPSIGDRDGDGYKDDQDGCPDEPEDFDGFEDSDGCPDPDNDNDGILDVDDRCPNVAEDRDGDEDEDGCPEGSDGDRDGDGILDSRDKCPDDPEDRDGFEDRDGCPDVDNDQDTILDVNDECPLDPEDMDGFEDEDGCPDPDNDHDQILDVNDRCPNEPETYNGTEDEDGCPDKGRVLIDGTDIKILDKVLFDTGKATIKPESNGILNAVASLLRGRPDFLMVEVAGHADERSSDASNLSLTRARAKAVVDALVARGIARDRFVSQGYGEYCPVDSASNPAAWEKNRRVEFKVIRTEDGDTNANRGCDAAKMHGVKPPALPERKEE